MTISKSIIEDVELEGGTEFYIQYSSVGQNRVVLSFDGPVANFQITIKAEEVEKIIAAMQKAKGEADAN